MIIKRCCICDASLASPIEGHSPLPYACWPCWTPLPLAVKAQFYRRAGRGTDGARRWLHQVATV